MPFTSLSPKTGPEARSGPCTLYYPNELYEHKEFFFKFCVSVELPNKDLWPLNRGRKRYNSPHDCDTCCDTKAQRYDSPPPLSHLPRDQQRGNKNKQNKRMWYLLQRRSEPRIIERNAPAFLLTLSRSILNTKTVYGATKNSFLHVCPLPTSIGRKWAKGVGTLALSSQDAVGPTSLAGETEHRRQTTAFRIYCQKHAPSCARKQHGTMTMPYPKSREGKTKR